MRLDPQELIFILLASLTKKYNKAFKSDSQRLAFLMSSLGFVFTVVCLRLSGSVAHTLMRR